MPPLPLPAATAAPLPFKTQPCQSWLFQCFPCCFCPGIRKDILLSSFRQLHFECACWTAGEREEVPSPLPVSHLQGTEYRCSKIWFQVLILVKCFILLSGLMHSGLGVTAKPCAGFQKSGLLLHLHALYFIRHMITLVVLWLSLVLPPRQEGAEVTQSQIKAGQICDAGFFVIGKNGPVTLGLYVHDISSTDRFGTGFYKSNLSPQNDWKLCWFEKGNFPLQVIHIFI